METVLSISIIVALVMWAGLSLATLFGKLVFDLLPFTRISPAKSNGHAEDEEEGETPEQKELALVA